jgi:hypothetical protein
MSTGTFVPPEFPPIDPETQIQSSVGPSLLVVNRSFDLGPSGASAPMMQTGASGTNEPVTIVTLDELIASHEELVRTETADRLALQTLLNPSRDVFRGPLFQWAARGFPGGFPIYTRTLTPPDVCTDGQSRSIGGYIAYLLGTPMEALCASIQELTPGIQVSFSFQVNSVSIIVSKA